MDWWMWLLILIVVIAIIWLLWWLLRPKKLPPPAQAAVTPPAAPAAAAPVVPDDLEIIEGIGPKIAGVLKSAGVDTFRKLADLEPAKISEILMNAGLRLADPASWPEQARLAAEGKSEELKTLQDSLKGGRQV